MLASDFFKNLFARDVDTRPEGLLGLFEPVITDDINEELCRTFTDEEISDALFQIGPLKAPGPDGFPPRFFQRNWGILKNDVIRGVRQFFADVCIPDGVNDTTIILILKKKTTLSPCLTFDLLVCAM